MQPTAALVPLLLILALSPPRGVEAALVDYDIDRLVSESPQIVCGRVTAVDGYWGSLPGLGNAILSRVTIAKTETWKGTSASKTVTLTVLGGVVEEDFQYCPESPLFVIGESVLVFLKSRRGDLWCTGWAHGKYRLSSATDASGKEGRFVEGRSGSPLTRRESFGEVKERIHRQLAAQATARSAPAIEPSGAPSTGGR